MLSRWQPQHNVHYDKRQTLLHYQKCSWLFSTATFLCKCSTMIIIASAARCSPLQMQQTVHYSKCSTLFSIASSARCSALQVQHCKCIRMFIIATAARCASLQLQHDVYHCNYSTMFIIASVAQCSLWQLQHDVQMKERGKITPQDCRGRRGAGRGGSVCVWGGGGEWGEGGRGGGAYC